MNMFIKEPVQKEQKERMIYMEFFDKLTKKASETYKGAAEKTSKIANDLYKGAII